MDNNTIHRSLQTSKNGFIYGSRLRFAHSIVIAFLFGGKNTDWNKKLKTIIMNSLKHGELLFLFGFIYKLLKLQILNKLKGKGLKEFLSGVIGGLIVYSGVVDRFDHGISHQITLYVGSRVMLGVGKKLAAWLGNRVSASAVGTGTGSGSTRAGTTPSAFGTSSATTTAKIENISWALYSTIVWGLVMYLYETQPNFLQKSLVHSMHYIYDNDQSSQFKQALDFLARQL